MFGFFKWKGKYPRFDLLESSEISNKYFIRTAEWGWLNEEIIWINDPQAPRVITLDPWPQWIFIAASGQMTVREYVFYMAGKYPRKIPDLLDKTILDEIERLRPYKIIELSNVKKRPDSKFELPVTGPKK